MTGIGPAFSAWGKSASRLNASSQRVGYLSWWVVVFGNSVVERCYAASHPVERCSRHELGTPLACSVGGHRGDESVRPRNSVVDIGEYVEAVGCVGVDRWPTRMRDDDRWPRVRVSGSEESGRDLFEGCLVDWFLVLEDLEVNEIVGTVVVAGSWVCRGAGMELLCDLMLDGEQWDRLWLWESDRCEQCHDVVRDS